MKKIMTIAFLSLVILIAGVFILRNAIAKIGLEQGVHRMTNLDLKIKKIDLGIWNTKLSASGIFLRNPKGFEDPVMIAMPEILIDYHLRDILSKFIHLEELKLNIQEVVIVKNKAGDLNLNHLQPASKAREQAAAKKEKPSEPSSSQPVSRAAPRIQIDILELQIGRVVYKDYSAGGEPKVESYNLNINEKFQNITDPNQLVGVIVSRAIMNNAISSAMNLNVSQLASNLGIESLNINDLGLERLSGQAAGLVSQATKALSKFSEEAGESSKGLGALLKKALDNQ